MTLLRLPEVSRRTGLSRSSIYDRIKRGTFPPPIRLDYRLSAWVGAEIDQWIARRIAESRNAP
ncbi:MAG: AlpA family transcriptional regulator [Chromatiales bacterium]|jgi:prophage regulatory protein|nr:AlpA family transcriptional regulator [Chromatiales bacterium]